MRKRNFVSAISGLAFLFVLMAVLLACSEDKNDTPPEEEPDNNVEENDYRVFLWVDGSANYAQLSSGDGIADYVKKAAEIGVTHLVVDVKETSGEVLYNSDIAPMNLEWKGATRTTDYDYLGIFLEEAQEYDIEVFASVNVFAGGKKSEKRGIVYDDEDKADWASMTYTKAGNIESSVNTSDPGTVMLNLSLPEVREYQLSVIEELVSKYPELAGITLDRCRWDGGLRGDFSDASRELFEDFIDQPLDNYPEDIFEWQATNGDYERIDGEFFQKWNEWRCSVVYDFMVNAKEKVRSINEDIEFSAYVGGWYGSYYDVGVNWASNRYSPYDNASYQSWATTTYHKYGYAQELDLLMTGNYSYDVTKEESSNWSVESMAETANMVTKGDTDVYSSLYLFDYIVDGEMDVDQMEKAIEMSFRESKGVMLFDVVYLEDYDCWENAGDGIESGIELKED